MKSISLLQFEEHPDKSKNTSSDMQGLYATPPSLSKGDFDTREKFGMLIIPAIVHIPPMTLTALLLRALN